MSQRITHRPKIKKIYRYVRTLFYKKHAVVSLTTVLIIGTVIMETALVGLVVSYLAGEQGLGVRASYVATAMAESGVDDVVLRIARNKDFSPGSNPYNISIGTYHTSILVTKSIIDSRFTRYTIRSTGYAFTKEIVVEATYVVDGYMGSLHVESYVIGA